MFKRLQFGLAAAGLILASGVVHAQYKWIDADGRIGYGDHVPRGNVKVLKGPRGFRAPTKSTVASGANLQLPIQLRKVSERFPVTLYTTTACAPCDLARRHLQRRGVPYDEKTISTARDLKAFGERGYGPDTNLPLLVVGNGKQIGYHALRWDDLLTSSGYPKRSSLPNNYEFGKGQALASAGQVANPGPGQASQGGGFSRGNVLTQQRSGPSGQQAKPDAPTIRF